MEEYLQKRNFKKKGRKEIDEFEDTYSMQSLSGKLIIFCLLLLGLAIIVPEMRMFGTASLAGLFIFLIVYGFFQIKHE